VATGQLVVSSNSSTSTTTFIGLSGTGIAPVHVAVTPASVSIATGASEQFVASVTGTSNPAVTWTVSGSGCSGTACGTISPTGLYTAPMTVPYSATVNVTSTSESDPSKFAAATVTIVSPAGTTYYLAPAGAGGNDSNSGLSPDASWLSPNHPVNCGDVIIAAVSSAYDAANFTAGKWGTVVCSAGNNVAWLNCVSFDACKIATSTQSGMWIDMSYWGVQGWEISATSPKNAFGDCVQIAPNSVTPIEVHHIVLANNVFNTCHEFGVGTYNQGRVGVDYLAIVGNIAYNSSGVASYVCGSGFSVNQPVLSDTLPGTHIYLGGNFSWAALNSNPCNGGTPTDGNGIVIDTPDGIIDGVISPYQGQIVVDNNLLVANGGRGLEVYDNKAGTGPFATIYLRHNTMWGNNRDRSQNGTYCGELMISSAFNTQAVFNLAVTNAQYGCGSNPIFAYFVGSSATTTNHIDNNWGYSVSGTDGGIVDSAGFSYGLDNIFGINPELANPSAPTTPNCGGTSGVPACMAPVIAGFTPTNLNATAYGYQIASGSEVLDPLFPSWLCNVNLPSGLVTMGCLTKP
jgi:hypothetical protein